MKTKNNRVISSLSVTSAIDLEGDILAESWLVEAIKLTRKVEYESNAARENIVKHMFSVEIRVLV